MANKTNLWQRGQSGNPRGRPPKGRALTDCLLAAANEKVVDGDGNPITRKKLLAWMLWEIAMSGQVTFWGANKTDDGTRRMDRSYAVKSLSEWFEIIKWLFAQTDGEFAITIKDDGDDDDAATGAVAAEMAPILYLPDNGRSKTDDETTEAAQTA